MLLITCAPVRMGFLYAECAGIGKGAFRESRNRFSAALHKKLCLPLADINVGLQLHGHPAASPKCSGQGMFLGWYADERIGGLSGLSCGCEPAASATSAIESPSSACAARATFCGRQPRWTAGSSGGTGRYRWRAPTESVGGVDPLAASDEAERWSGEFTQRTTTVTRQCEDGAQCGARGTRVWSRRA